MLACCEINIIFSCMISYAASFGTCVNMFLVYINAGAPFYVSNSTSYFTAIFDALFDVDVMIWQMTLYMFRTLGVERVKGPTASDDTSCNS